MTISQAFDLAFKHHQAGRLADAEALYRQILTVQPNHADALHLLGLIAHQRGRHDLAAEWIGQSIALNPTNPAAHCNFGEACRAMGRLDEAMAAYRRALQLQPDFPEPWNNLGIALRDQGQFDEAVAACRRALQFRPDYAEAHNNLGLALQDLGQPDEAMIAYRRALQLKPEFPEACNNLGIALREQGQLDEAMAACHSALRWNPGYAEAYSNLGIALRDRGQLDEAIAAFRRALELKPGYAEGCNNLGNALRERGQLGEAIAACRRALELKPDYAEAHNNLGIALTEESRLDEAVGAYRRALELRPDHAGAHNNLSAALKRRGQLDEAIAACRRALEFRPDYPEARINLGVTLAGAGQLDESIAAFRRALELRPEDAGFHSGLIYTLQFHPDYDANIIAEEQQRWNRRFSEPLQQFALPHANDRNLDRRLRIGYVSPDFRDHPVGRYVLPLFEQHDRKRFEIVCYSGVVRPDWMTERLRALAETSCEASHGGWRNTVGISDDHLAEMIREDGVDILVDLALHTAGNRLPVFARRPAPVQVTWLAYPGGTGLGSIDYRLTDGYMEPPGEAVWSAEEPVRLPDCWCCYDPVDKSPDVNALPALTAQGVTFGSLNNFTKVHEGVLARWARVLEAVKGSRLVTLCPEGRTREWVQAFFGAQEIEISRVEFVGALPRWDYLSLYQRIDIGLDPFPCNGMTTTCDALWMGVPVLTLPGKTAVSRAGLSLLSTVGLAELATFSEEDYLRSAVELAGNLPRLAEMRATLRARMQAAPLMDAPRFARSVEAAYRKMWQAWVRKQSLAHLGI